MDEMHGKNISMKVPLPVAEQIVRENLKANHNGFMRTLRRRGTRNG